VTDLGIRIAEHDADAGMTYDYLLAYAGYLSIQHGKKVVVVSHHFYAPANQYSPFHFRYGPRHYTVGVRDGGDVGDPDIIIMPRRDVFSPSSYSGPGGYQRIHHYYIGVYRMDGQHSESYLEIFNNLHPIATESYFEYDGNIPPHIIRDFLSTIRVLYRSEHLPQIPWRKAEDDGNFMGHDYHNTSLYAALIIESILTRGTNVHVIHSSGDIGVHRRRMYSNLKELLKDQLGQYSPIDRYDVLTVLVSFYIPIFII
jgi:hypothetical protein